MTPKYSGPVGSGEGDGDGTGSEDGEGDGAGGAGQALYCADAPARRALRAIVYFMLMSEDF